VLPLDDIDSRIVMLLGKDMEIPYSAMANELGVSLTTIYSRIRRLRRFGVIKKIVAQIDYEKIGYEARALVGVCVSPNAKDRVVAKFREMEFIRAIYWVTGRYDCVLDIVTKNNSELGRFLSEKMGKIDDIQRTETMLIIDSE
jgi:Lrp/AsnC family transcriptional regulator for asnA, asnC and gidA